MADFQSHGVVLLIDEQRMVRSATRACEAVLGRDERSVVGNSVGAVLPELGDADDGVAGGDPDHSWRLTPRADGTPVTVRPFDAGPGLVGLDILAAGPYEPTAEAATVERIIRWSARIQATRDRVALMQAGCAIAAELSGFEGVWGVRVEHDSTGFVEAVSVSGSAPDTTGSVVAAMHLPPGDVTSPAGPSPFFVVDVASPANVLEPAADPALDLTGSALHRPFGDYLSFLGSIGARAAFSIPVIAHDATWARLIGHHPAPKALSSAAQAELRLVGLAAGVQLQKLLAEERSQERLASAVLSAKLARSFAASGSLPEGFAAEPAALLDLCGASSAIIRVDNETTAVGEAISDELVEALLGDARKRFAGHDRPVVSTTTMPVAGEAHAGGYLAMRLDEAAVDVVIWVRRGRTRTLRWVEIADSSSPDGRRASTVGEAVSQVGRSAPTGGEPWSAGHIEAVAALSAEIADVGLVPPRAGTNLHGTHSEFDAFARTIAHDLRAPIRGISQFVEFLKEDASPRLTTTDVDQLDTVLRLADRGTTLLDDLSRYAKLGEATWTTDPTDLPEAVADAINQLGEQTLGNASVHVDRGTITADPAALRLLLAHLIRNSAVYAEDSVHVRIGVRSLAEARLSAAPPPRLRDRAGHTPVLFVEDDGIGIAAEYHSRVFGLFRRANEAMPDVAGSGTGLAMCQRIAQRHGGDIWLTSTPGVGTTVFVVLEP